MPIFSWLFPEPLPVDTVAPDFTLSDQDRRAVTLSKLRGKNVILIFYPGDETSVCRKQLCEFRDNWADVQAKNALLFGINPQTAESHAKFKINRGFPFPLLVDTKQHVAKLYRCGGLVIKRTVYLVGPKGQIRYAKRGKPNPTEVLQTAE